MILNTTITGLIFPAMGMLIMIEAALHWGIVSRPGKLLNRIIGNTVSRVVYFIGGIFLFVVGIGWFIGASWV